MNQNTASGLSFNSCLKAISNLYKYGFREVRVNKTLQDGRLLCSVDRNSDVDFEFVEGNAHSLAELQKHVQAKLDRVATDFATGYRCSSGGNGYFWG